jgi:hypothetical protein
MFVPSTIEYDATHLEYMKGFKLNIAALIPEHVHHHLQISFAGNVSVTKCQKHDLTLFHTTLTHRVITLKLALSSRISPNSLRLCRLVT